MKNLITRIIRKIQWLSGSHKRNKAFEEIGYDKKRKIMEGYREKFQLNYFVETGTFLGDTTHYFKNKFRQLFSVELSTELADRAKQRFKEDAKVEIIQGNSADVLPAICSNLHEPALFWLDGHYSSEFFVGQEYIITAKADKNTPIEKELDILMASPYNNIILIDDARLFTGKYDYPTLAKIKKKISAGKLKYNIHVHADIIHIIPAN